MLPLSVSIIASNEERNILRCLQSVKDISSEIILVYNDCTDKTVQIAREHNADCFEEKWHGHREQKNIALSKASQPWVLCMDADEELSPDLRGEIINFLKENPSNEINGANFNRLSFFMERWIKHGDWYPDTKVRLIRNGTGKWKGSREHDKLHVQGKTVHIKGDLLHYSYPSLNTFVEKTIYFSDIYLSRQLDACKRWNLMNVIIRPPWRFIRAYFLRLGFLDGFPGLFIAVATAYMTFVKHSRLYEHESKNK